MGCRFRTRPFSPEHLTVFGEVTRPAQAPYRLIPGDPDSLTVRSYHLTTDPGRSADLGAKAAETLRSARSGVPGPSGEAAATADRREANEWRCGGGGGPERSPSAGWREVADRLGASEGCSHE